MSLDEEVAEHIRDALPDTEEIIVQYLAGLYEDADEDFDNITSLTHDMLESFGRSDPAAFQGLMDELSKILRSKEKTHQQQYGELTRLDRVMSMNNRNMLSNTMKMGDAVDLSSVNKGK